jgi:hypothetical protein
VRTWIALAAGLVGLALTASSAAAHVSPDASCPGPREGTITALDGGDEQWAQTFTAQASGVLTAAQADVTKDAGGADWVLQVAPVDAAGTPTHAVLASATIPDSSVPLADSIVSASFATPAAVTVGQQYALVVTRPDSGLSLGIRQDNDDGCGGQLFSSDGPTEPFEPITFPNGDMVFAVFVEPDCDNDGVGDETQDASLGSCHPRTISLDANKNKVKKGRKVRLSGQIAETRQAGACAANQAVELQRKKPKQTQFTTVEQLQTDAAGIFSAKKKVKKTFEYRAQIAETATCAAQTSNTEKVKAKKPK